MKEYVSLEKEVRDGFEVCEKQKRIWNVEIDLLVELLKVCRKYDLKVIAWGGTMLGAVRHKGFIPWDDDMDVALPREDYEKLLSIAPIEFKQPLFLQTAISDKKFFLSYARLRNSNTTGMIAWNESEDYNNGIYIDIFPLDGIVGNIGKLKVQFYYKTFIEQIMKCYFADDEYVSRKSKRIVWILKLIGKTRKYEKWFETYTKIVSTYNGNTTEVGDLVEDWQVVEKYRGTKTSLSEIIEVPFESIKVPIPRKFSIWLNNAYGNYMEYPPIEQRGKWHEDMIIFDPDKPYKEFIKEREIK